MAAYDGLLANDALARLHAAIAGAGFTRTEIARAETAAFKHWISEIPLPAMASMPFVAPTFAALAQFEPARRFRAYRCYVNSAQYGDMLFTHTDCLPGAGEITALWFICERWDPEWGGETLFFDADGDARAAVSPRPGRLVLFDGELPHCGRPPSRICTEARYTLAIKLEPVG